MDNKTNSHVNVKRYATSLNNNFDVPVYRTPDSHTPDAFYSASNVTQGINVGNNKKIRTTAPRAENTPKTIPGSIPRSRSSLPPRNDSKNRSKISTPLTPHTPRTPGRSVMERTQNVVAVVEFRNRQMVGLASINLMRPELELFQYDDNQTYTNTMIVLNQYDPVTILMSDTARESALYKMIAKEFEMINVETYKRKYFNENQGLEFISRYGNEQCVRNISFDSSKYLCLSAAACVMKFCEFSQNVMFAPNGLNIKMRTLEGHMKLGINTRSNLELVFNLNNFRNRKPGANLFSTLNHCKLASGARLLRSNILQPLTDVSTINARLDVVEEIISNEGLFFSLNSMLSNFVDVDQAVQTLVYVPNVPTEATSTNTIISILKLKKTLESLQPMYSLLVSCQHPLLLAVAENLNAPNGKALLEAIGEILEENATINKKIHTTQARAQIVFAIKSGVNGLLDVARATYCEAIEEIFAENEKYVTQLNSASMKVKYCSSRGYHLNIPIEILSSETNDENDPTGVFIQRVIKGKRVYATTEDLISLDGRQKESFAEIVYLTERMLGDLLCEIRRHIAWLFNVSENLAFLDLMLAFATNVTFNTGLCRPQFTEDMNSPIAIKDGRHPILHMSRSKELIPNDCFLSPAQPLHIVTGSNNSGKSTYLKQVATLTILSHIGSFVPASFASFRITDQVFTRMSTEETIESNAGSYFTEMKETNEILSEATHRSLILIDELGRGTASLDGTAMAWSVCEAVLAIEAYCLFATHFHELIHLENVYGRVKNVNLLVEPILNGLSYKYRLIDGPISDKVSNYGIHVASLSGFPPLLIEHSTHIANSIRARANDKDKQAKVLQTRAYSALLTDLLSLKGANFSIEELHSCITQLKNKYLLSSNSP